jgi:hypothetical protein
LLAFDFIQSLHLHRQRSDVSEEHVICFFWIDPTQLTKTVTHEVDLLQSSPIDLTAVFKVAYIHSSHAPDEEIIASTVQHLSQAKEASQP